MPMEAISLNGAFDSRHEDAVLPYLRDMAREMRRLSAIVISARLPGSLTGLKLRSRLRRLDVTIERMEVQALAMVKDCAATDDTESGIRNAIGSCDRLISKIQGLLGVISHLQECAKSLIQTPFPYIESFFRTRDEDDIAIRDVTEALDHAVTSFKQASVEIIAVIKDLGDSQAMHLQYQIAEESAIFIGHIMSESVTYESWPKKHDNKPSTHANYEEICDQLTSWLYGEEPVYCLSGEANTGKSAIAYHFCADLASSQQPSPKLGASIFISRCDDSLDSLYPILPSIAYQLLPQLRKDVVAAARDHLRRGDQPGMRATFDDLLRGGLATIPPSDRETTILVIDGLDQCKEIGKLPELLEYLLALPREFPWLRIFIALQARPLVMAVLARPAFSNTVRHHQLQHKLPNSALEVRRYIHDRVPTIPGHEEYLREHPKILQRLVKRAGKSATYARLAMRFLDIEHDPTALDIHYSALLPEKINPGLSPLDTLYLAALRHAFSDHPSDNQRELLYSLVFGSDDLEAKPIVFYEDSETEFTTISAVDDLRSILTITILGEVGPLNPSFCRFLVDKKRCDVQFWVNPVTHILCVCLVNLLHMQLVTEALEPLPPTSSMILDRDSGNEQPAPLILWSSLLSQASYSARVVQHLQTFIPSLSLAMFAWVTETGQVVHTGINIQRYLKDENNYVLATRILSKYMMFTIFVQLWRNSVPNRRFEAQWAMEDIIRTFSDHYPSPVKWIFNGDTPSDMRFNLRFTGGAEYFELDIYEDDYDLESFQNLMKRLTRELQQATGAPAGVPLDKLAAGSHRVKAESHKIKAESHKVKAE